MGKGVTRRGLLVGAGAMGLGAAAGCGAGSKSTADRSTSSGSAAAAAVAARSEPFYGQHQAGIATPAQDRLAFAAFDVVSTSRSELVTLMQTWTAAALAMTEGRQVPGGATSPKAPPQDTGEAVGLAASSLTVTVGFGPGLFDQRFGLAARRPSALTELPALPGDELDPDKSGGDLCIQACANDPQVAFHAVRNLARLGRGIVQMRWFQLGFGRTSSTSTSQETPRNLMGFKDGTRNIKGEDAGLMGSFVWVGSETDQPWMRGGSYVVTRRIRMLIESWDRDSLQDQENVFGRSKNSGAPLTGKAEFDAPNFEAQDAAGQLVIPADSHIRLAAPENNAGIRILRRGYSYTDGIDPVTGQLDAGLFFIAYLQDPHKQFVPLQRKLGVNDSLNEYILHKGSAVFACPPGVQDSKDYWGRTLLT
jgi:deferrochelatase/peroxidase EfeB